MQVEHNNQPKINQKKKIKIKTNKNLNMKMNKKYSKTKLIPIPR